ncbi:MULTISPECIES: NINE protein [unclassified Flavihumibacter]|jgi:TM2 domain-containing membrane protein YozV|uniref:NINE protein n=1 Tax=unclassified Flavihumibacter TaxID=2621068 RepID=UPI00057D350B|nr:NINE protein [Flavihumibacter sp. ZG627]KIC91163.1 membrane protein [Flavihumibacter sp. ZG627]MCG7857127.1 NINE protein [Flavihumibacter sediminis]
MQNYLAGLTDLQPEEMAGINELTKNMTASQQQQFFMLYQGKRKKPQDILLLTCLGFIVIAGVQRFVIGQVGMGLLYLFTGGLCLIGTIVDVVNYKKLATDYNLEQMYEASRMVV